MIAGGTEAGLCADGAHARDTGDERRDVRAKTRGDVLAVERTGRGETDQQRSDNRIGIELERGDDRGGANRAVERRFTVGHPRVAADLACELQCGGEYRAFSGGVGRRERFEPRRYRLRRGGTRRDVQNGNHGQLATGGGRRARQWRRPGIPRARRRAPVRAPRPSHAARARCRTAAATHARHCPGPALPSALRS